MTWLINQCCILFIPRIHDKRNSLPRIGYSFLDSTHGQRESCVVFLNYVSEEINARVLMLD